MAHAQLIAGNWKMNGLGADLEELALLANALGGPATGGATVLVCPPATLITGALERAGGRFKIGGQNCHHADKGAFTGEISAQMLADAGATHVIVGHSERRTLAGETNSEVLEKARAALGAGLEPIICVGESAAERVAGRHLDVVLGQIKNSVPKNAVPGSYAIAYEPVWAIGTGKTATLDDIAQMHSAIRNTLISAFADRGADTPILYGGSVNGKNASKILGVAEVGGALVGGASLTAPAFLSIIHAAPANR